MYNAQFTADLIKKMLVDKHETAKNMCQNCKLGVNTLSNIRRGDVKSIETFYTIADYLDCSVDYLLGRTDIPKVNRGEEDEYVLIASRSPGNNVPVQKIKLTKEMKELIINGENSDNEDL